MSLFRRESRVEQAANQAITTIDNIRFDSKTTPNEMASHIVAGLSESLDYTDESHMTILRGPYLRLKEEVINNPRFQNLINKYENRLTDHSIALGTVYENAKLGLTVAINTKLGYFGPGARPEILYRLVLQMEHTFPGIRDFY